MIPYARGRVRSLPLSEAAEEAASLAGRGYRELVLTGIEIASYGSDLPGSPALADVVEAVSAAAPMLRLRLGSLEPTAVTEEFCSRLAALGTVCDHFHLSLQSGSDGTLARMHRKYDTAQFLAVAERLRRHFPHCALTGDLIAGFPGETEAEHAETLAFIEKVSFAALHVFPYSRRPGTPADRLPGQPHRRRKVPPRARGARGRHENAHGLSRLLRGAHAGGALRDGGGRRVHRPRYKLHGKFPYRGQACGGLSETSKFRQSPGKCLSEMRFDAASG